MEITDQRINKYIDEHTSQPVEILNKIERETYLKSIFPRMISGKTQGRFLAMIAKMIRPSFILEIGTFTGYSAICLAEGLANGGQLHTIEINEELRAMNDENFKAAGLGRVIKTHFGNALDIIPNLGIQFDLIFIDADKINYSKYYELALGVLKTDGFILADNVLWSGKVIASATTKVDKDAQAVIDFNKQVQDDPRVENVIVPLRDGMTLIQKIC
jgi:predicted O-methyltransferase YrrM